MIKKSLIKRLCIKDLRRCLDNWNKDIYLKWTPEMIDFHPKNPEVFEKAVKISVQDLPKSVINNFIN